MVGTTLDKKMRRITFNPNMFEYGEHIIRELDSELTYKQIFESLTTYPIEFAVIIDGDVKIEPENYDQVPESDNLYIKLFPSGGKAKKILTSPGGQMGIGALLVGAGVAVGVFAGWTGIGGVVSIALIGAGASMIMGGVVTWAAEVPSMDTSSRSSKENPSIRGSKNEIRKGSRIPVQLGRHLIIPDVASLPYISISDDGKDQYVHQLFCAGYNDIIIDTNSYKIGDTPLNSTYYDFTLNLHQDGNLPAVYPARTIPTGVQALLEYNDPVIRTTPPNTKEIEVFISFPQGLVKYQDGKKRNFAVSIFVHYRRIGTVEEGGDFLELCCQEGAVVEGWKLGVWLTCENATNETWRKRAVIVLDNLLDTGADYNATRQYDIRVTRMTADSTSTEIVDKCYWEMLQCKTGVFQSGTFNGDPVISTIRPRLTLIGLRIKASESANGVIDNLSVIGQSKVPIYSGSGSGPTQWVTEAGSSNPASLFLYVLRNTKIAKKPITDNQVDWSSFEKWYTFCETKELYCNTHITYDIITGDILNNIATCGRASWGIVDGKYIVIPDDEQVNIVQYFTPRNSWGFTATKVYPERTTGLRAKFIDASSGYEQAERVVYRDGRSSDDIPTIDDKIDEVSLFGCTSADQVWKQCMYLMACGELRPEVYSFNVDIEHLVCTRWDRIAINHDVPLLGLGSGRLKIIYTSVGNVTGVEIDERVLFEPSKTYGITIRMQDGSGVTLPVINPAVTLNVETNDLYFVTPFSIGTHNITIDDLCMFGTVGNEVVDMVITDIEPNDAYSAKVTCVPYNSGIYTADTGTIPPYIPKISVPGDSTNAVIVGITIDPGLLAVNVGANQGEQNNYDTAITATYETLIKIGGASFEVVYPYYFANNKTILYYNEYRNAIYEKTNYLEDEGTQFLSSPGIIFCPMYYVKLSDGKLYDWADNNIINYPVWSPQVTENGKIIFIKMDDMVVHVYDPLTMIDTATPFVIEYPWLFNYGTNTIAVWDSQAVSGNPGIGIYDFMTDTLTGLFALASPPISFQRMTEDTFVYLDENFNLYKYNIDTEQTLLFVMGVKHFDVYEETLYFTSIYDNLFYKQFPDASAAKIGNRPYIRTMAVTMTISGDILINTNTILNVSDADLNKLEIGNILNHTAIPTDAVIQSLDYNNHLIILTKNATATQAGATIEINTSKILLNGNTSIASKSITAEAIEDNSITSSLLSNDIENILKKKDVDNLIIKRGTTNPNYQLDLSFTGLRVEDIYLTSVSVVLDITTMLDTGTEAISTWYYIWCFANDAGGYVFRFSASPTAPTVPSGYTKKRVIGAVRNDASGNFVNFYQKNKMVAIGITQVTAVSSTAWASVNCGGVVSALCEELHTACYMDADSGDLYMGPITGISTTWHRRGIHQYIVPMFETQTIYYIVSGGTGNITCGGYQINI